MRTSDQETFPQDSVSFFLSLGLAFVYKGKQFTYYY